MATMFSRKLDHAERSSALARAEFDSAQTNENDRSNLPTWSL